MQSFFFKILCSQRFFCFTGNCMYFSQNHNISVINIKNGRVYQESILLSPCELMAILEKLNENKIDCALNPFTCP